uniref:C2H2-type domain-containing protein n=1 Tax=Naja naja TaxID=35670 RepID=A0A8C6X8X4_NAJNA
IGATFINIKESTQEKNLINACSVERASCPDCEKSFKSNNVLEDHLRIHTEETSHKCMECGESFWQSEHLYRHQRIHCGEKPYKCLKCGKSFNMEENLYRHESIHTGEKLNKFLKDGESLGRPRSPQGGVHKRGRKHKCPECEKSFQKNGDLQRHITVHTGVRKYQCPECEKSFKRKDHLESHLRIHSEKLNKCLECGMSFSHRSSLYRHQRTHLEEKPNKCLEGSDAIRRRWNPQRIQEREKKYQCPNVKNPSKQIENCKEVTIFKAINAQNVKNPSTEMEILKGIEESTQIETYINAWNVERASVVKATFIHTKGSTQERNHINVRGQPMILWAMTVTLWSAVLSDTVQMANHPQVQ